MALSLIVEKFSATEEDGTQSDLMSTSSSIFELGNNWKVDDDLLWQNFTYNLFSAGLDSAGYEVIHEDCHCYLANCNTRICYLLFALFGSSRGCFLFNGSNYPMKTL